MFGADAISPFSPLDRSFVLIAGISWEDGRFLRGGDWRGKSTPPEAGQAHIYYLLSRAKTVEGARNTAALYGFVHRGGKLSFCFDADMGNPCGKEREQYADTQIVRGGRQPRRRAIRLVFTIARLPVFSGFCDGFRQIDTCGKMTACPPFPACPAHFGEERQRPVAGDCFT